jgi:hypothetical protein
VEYVEAYARAGFVHPRDRKILWTHLVRLHLKLQHVNRSRGWNIMGTSKVAHVGNEIELGMVIPMIRS